jgi:hypothetical protein
MKAASVSDIKKELQSLSKKEVDDLCLQLIKYKKENKELATYLLFESNDEKNYIAQVKVQIDDEFSEINKHNLYQAKKTIRKILRLVNKYAKYSGNVQTHIELLIYFCERLKNCGIRMSHSVAITKIYASQILKIKTLVKALHEDLQYDFQLIVEELL